MYVVSLQGVLGADKRNAGRLDRFRQDWAKTCGATTEFTLKVCPGVVDPEPGSGAMRSFIICFEQALHDGAHNPVFFQDGARPVPLS